MFSPGDPIENFDQDRLRRTEYARRLADALVEYEEPASLVVGLDGAWGTGKTSILNLVLKAMGDRTWAATPIVVRFNPWYFSDHENLLRQFFTAMAQRLSQPDLAKVHAEAADKIELFSEMLDSVSDDVPLPWLAAFVPVVLLPKLGAAVSRYKSKQKRKLAEEASSLEALKEQISKRLADGGRRVIVVIDDVDRLTEREIRLIFKLVKAVADFRYVTYVVAFDDTYVKRALEKFGGAEFLEKIINVPLSVPAITRIQVQRLILDRLQRFADVHDSYAWSDNPRVLAVVQFITATFRTIRHLERTVNALNFTANIVAPEVDLADLIAIVALRAILPDAYRFVRDSRESLLYTPQSQISRDTSDATAKATFEAFLGTIPQQEALSSLLAALFPRFDQIMNRRQSRDSGDEHSWNRERRICSLKSFDTYFAFDVADDDISAEQMQSILLFSSEEEFAASFRQLLEDGSDKAIAFLERLEDHVSDDAVTSRARSIIKVLIDAGDRFEPNISGFPFKLDGHTLIMRIVYQIAIRVPDEAERFDILKDAIRSSTTLYQAATTIGVEDQSHQRFGLGDGRPRDTSKELVTDEHLDVLEALMRDKIAAYAADGRLASEAALPYILFRWLEWSDKDTLSGYVLNGLDDVNFTRLVVVMGRNQGVQRLGRQPTLKESPISQLAELDAILTRLRAILTGPSRAVLPGDLLRDAEIIFSNSS